MSDTCSLFPPFGDPWPSRLLPSQPQSGLPFPPPDLPDPGSESAPLALQVGSLPCATGEACFGTHKAKIKVFCQAETTGVSCVFLTGGSRERFGFQAY